MKFYTRVIRVIGLIVTTGFFVSLVNLPGCARSYGDKTQTAWLVKRDLNLPVYQTEATAGAGSAESAFSGQVTTLVSGHLESPTINELSGMAVSRRKPDVFWAINDSGNVPELFAIGPSGKHLASYRLPFQNRDWEDMASYQYQGQPWLLVADSGDNIRKNKISTLHFFTEPALPQRNNRIENHHKVDIQYEDGPQNVESISVSVSERLIFLISKNAGVPRIYAVPLDVMGSKKRVRPVLAKLVGRLLPLHWTDDDRWLEKTLASRFLLGATSMDISADDSLAVIGNYRHAYLYRRQSGQTWLQALGAKPQVISSHRLAQSESIAFSNDATKVIIGSEGRYAPLLTVSSE